MARLDASLELIRHRLYSFTPGFSKIILRAAGSFYLASFPMLGRDFFHLMKDSMATQFEPDTSE